MTTEPQYPTKLVRILKGHSGLINSVRYTKRGNYCMSCSQDRTICLWNPNRDDMKDGYLIKRYKGPHGYGVKDISITSDDAKFGSCGEEKESFIWDISTSKIVNRLYGHTQRINTIIFNQEDTLALTGSYDSTVRIYDLNSHNNSAFQILTEAKDSISCILMTNQNIITSSIDGHIRSYDIRAGKLYDDDFKVPIIHMSLSFDSRCVYASTLENQSLLIERTDGLILNKYKSHKAENYKVEGYINNNDDYIYSGSEDGNIYIYDFIKTNVVHVLKHHQGIVSTLAINPTKKSTQLLAGSYDSTISVWE